MLKFDMLPWRLVKRRHDRKLIIKQNMCGNEQFSQVYNENTLALHDKKKMLVI